MKVLHTSDWHLGRSLYGRKRYEEFEAFLDWLVKTIEIKGIDVLLVAGDVFDNSAPSNRAQKLYYHFLCKVAASSCRHVVVIAGNHDSPTFLNAPKELLEGLDIHVVGSASTDPEEEVIALQDEQGQTELIVCAVPYLRDRDIRIAEAGESIEDKKHKLIDGIRSHYAEVSTVAEQKRAALGADIPVVAMGHLFTSGGQTIEGDGVRELYIGSLAHIDSTLFRENFDYVALGHLHVPQKVDGREWIRYSGSPLPMGFGEARQQKYVCEVVFDRPTQNKPVCIQQIEIPVFQQLVRIKGDWDLIAEHLLALSVTDSSPWLEIIYESETMMPDLRERLDDATAGTGMEILRIQNNRIADRILSQADDQETLDRLSVQDVFERCLAAHDIPAGQQPTLLHAYQEILRSLDDQDTQAE